MRKTVADADEAGAVRSTPTKDTPSWREHGNEFRGREPGIYASQDDGFFERSGEGGTGPHFPQEPDF